MTNKTKIIVPTIAALFVALSLLAGGLMSQNLTSVVCSKNLPSKSNFSAAQLTPSYSQAFLSNFDFSVGKRYQELNNEIKPWHILALGTLNLQDQVHGGFESFQAVIKPLREKASTLLQAKSNTEKAHLMSNLRDLQAQEQDWLFWNTKHSEAWGLLYVIGKAPNLYAPDGVITPQARKIANINSRITEIDRQSALEAQDWINQNSEIKNMIMKIDKNSILISQFCK